MRRSLLVGCFIDPAFPGVLWNRLAVTQLNGWAALPNIFPGGRPGMRRR